MLELILLVIRAVQFIFAIIVLGLTGHVASYGDTPSQDAFLVFVSVWTMLVLIYLALSPRFFPNLAHIWAIVALDALTMLFWFAGFIALAVFHSDLVRFVNYYYIYGCASLADTCPTMEAAVVFGAFEWALFVVTTVFATLDALRKRNKSGVAAQPTDTTTATV